MPTSTPISGRVAVPTQAWSRHLHEQAGARLDELDYWQAQLHDAPHALPCEDPQGALENRHERKLVLTLDAERTRQLLQEAPAAYGPRSTTCC